MKELEVRGSRRRLQTSDARLAGVELSDVLEGGGELGALMRAKDWSRTPLGPPATWPRSLKTCVRIILTSRQPMFVWWGESLINLYNDAYKTIVGGKHPEALGQPASVVWREIWKEVGPRAESALRTNEGTYDEALLLIMERYGYQEETYYTFSYSPVPNDEGGIGGIICANTDDTQRIISERQLVLLREVAAETADARAVTESCERSARAFTTNSRDLPFALIYVLEPDQKTLRLTGAAGIARGHPVAPLTASVDGDSLWPFAEVLRTHEAAIVPELRAVEALPTGPWSQAPKAAVVLPIGSTGQAGPAGVLIVGLNPFRRFDQGYKGFLSLLASQVSAGIANAQAYQDEKRRAEALAEIDRAKTLFFSNVSHEFRTPLTLILGPVEDLLAGAQGALPEAQQSQLQLLHRNALRLQKLVNSLLDFSRIEAGRVQASYEPLDLATLTRELASVFRSAFDRAQLSLTIDCPPLSEPVYVDRDMWEKIVLNLLSNALKFTFKGGVEVSLRCQDEGVALCVKDTGVGVPPEEVPRLFERFHRVEGTQARTHEGSGIGLALVQELAKMHGGNIRAESQLGVGTTFTVWIPGGSVHLPPERIARSRTIASSSTGAVPFVEEALRWLPTIERTDAVISPASPALREPSPVEVLGVRSHGRVLLADDNADMREYVRRLLAPTWTVETAPDGAAALEAARARRPDLVLTDVMMPNLDGFGLLRELRADPLTRAIPVVMLSARAGEEAKVEGLQAGADDYVIKPFAARELLARVATHVELSRLRTAQEAERAKLHGLFMNAPAIICVTKGPDHVFELSNPFHIQSIGGRNVVGMPIREALPELKSQPFIGYLDEVYRTGKPYLGKEAPIRLDRAGNGDLVETFVNFVYQPSFGLDGQVDGVVVFAFDITDQVLARRKVEVEHQATEEARLRAEAAVRVRDDFLSIASHELRTPLTAMGLQTQGALRLLQSKDGDNTPRVIEKVESVRRSTLRLEQLIQGLLDVSRIAAGRMELHPEEMDLTALTTEVCTRFEDESKRFGSPIEVVASGPVVGHWDLLRLDQVLTNLLSNAVKYGHGHPVQVTVQATAQAAQIRVQDRGIGVAAEDQARIFERFERAVSPRHFGGLGLGLWITRQIVETMGGRVSVKSVPEQGATFTVDLPR